VSISIGITFYTATTRRQALAYQANRLLRRLGLAPRPPAERPWLDRLKMPLGWIAVHLLKWRRPGYQAPPGLVRPVRMN
jgi:hypothetical protein